MNICVAGWHFDPRFIPYQCPYPMFTVCHREPPVPLDHSVTIPNIGLEFGCYDHYLKRHWYTGDTFFTHDDNEITLEALEEIAHIAVDQAFLFSSEMDAKANGMAHGRAMFCSNKFLERLKKDGGFWYDEGPMHSDVIPATTANQPDYHNLGIQTFVSYLRLLPPEYSVNKSIVIPGLKTGYRGRL